MKEATTNIKMVSENTAQIYLPATIMLDSLFPFDRKDQEVTIRIVGEKIIIEKLNQN